MEGLPDHRPQDYTIELKDGAQLKFFKVYYTNERQDAELKRYLESNLKIGYIRPLISPAGYLVLFVLKKDRKLYMYIDYRQLNEQTVKNRYPLLLISRLRDQLSKVQYFTRLNLPIVYTYIRIKLGDEQKIVFCIPYGHYEYLVIPFGLINVPTTFQLVVDYTIQPFLNRFIVYYLDNILIFSKILKEYQKYIKVVLDTLYKQKLLVNIDKSEFYITKIVFLGFEISLGQIRMELAKIKAIKIQPQPIITIEVRGFIGFANFYRIFIRNFSDIIRPLYDLTKKDIVFQQKEEYK